MTPILVSLLVVGLVPNLLLNKINPTTDKIVDQMQSSVQPSPASASGGTP
jgi:NADH:ubiquinone oxidoreductase subunit 4 (subunit M)